MEKINQEFDLYKDIKDRTDGEIYIGVVGPVRTGKSTFIKRFMDLCVLPYVEDSAKKDRMVDELPQSAQGRTIMTTEPKFIPQEAVELVLPDAGAVKVRLIDCVGYMVEGASGHLEGDGARMVRTPWSDEEIPFTQAAEIGTEKVINDHATLGVVVTTDGSIGELPRENYLEAEAKTITQLQSLGKPFVILLNCERPYSEEARSLAKEMEEHYHAAVLPVNCKQMRVEDVERLLGKMLMEFSVEEVRYFIPKWTETLPASHWLKAALIELAAQIMQEMDKMRDSGNVAHLGNVSRDISKTSAVTDGQRRNYNDTYPRLDRERRNTNDLFNESFKESDGRKNNAEINAQNMEKLVNARSNERFASSATDTHVITTFIKEIRILRTDPSTGTVDLGIDIADSYYYDHISDMAGVRINGEYELIRLIRHLTEMKDRFDRVGSAVESVEQKGYGVVMPALSEISMDDPVLIQHGNKYGVKMKATSPSIHMIQANIETEIAPIVGSKEQAEDLIAYIQQGEQEDGSIWNTNIFGKSVGELMEDGIRSKVQKMDDEIQMKLQETMQKIVNESNGGLICLII